MACQPCSPEPATSSWWSTGKNAPKSSDIENNRLVRVATYLQPTSTSCPPPHPCSRARTDGNLVTYECVDLLILHFVRGDDVSCRSPSRVHAPDLSVLPERRRAVNLHTLSRIRVTVHAQSSPHVGTFSSTRLIHSLPPDIGQWALLPWQCGPIWADSCRRPCHNRGVQKDVHFRTQLQFHLACAACAVRPYELCTVRRVRPLR